MTIRAKLLSINTVLILAGVAVLIVAASRIITSRFADLEREQVTRDVHGLQADIDRQTAYLLNQTVVQACHPATAICLVTFETAHLRSLLHQLGGNGASFDYVVMYDSRRERLLTASGVPALSSLSPVDRAKLTRLAHAAWRSSRGYTGMLSLASMPIIFAAYPIPTGHGNSPRGVLMTGRRLTAVIPSLLLPHQHLRAYGLYDHRLPDDFVLARTELADHGAVLVQPRTDDTVAGFVTLDDPYGAPAVMLRLVGPRTHVHQGDALFHVLLLVIVGVSLGLGVIGFIIKEKLAFSRLLRFSEHISRIGRDGSLVEHLPVEGHDEVSELAASINGTIDSLLETQRAMRESEARYRAIVEDQSDLICRFSPDGNLTFANEAYRRYFYWKPLLPHTSMPLILLEDRERLVNHLAALTPENPVAAIWHRVVLPDGQVRWHAWSDRAIFDTGGQVIEYQSVGQDITERVYAEEALHKAHEELEQRVQARTAELCAVNESLQREIGDRRRAEEALRASEQQYRLLAENVSDVIRTMDMDGRITYASASIAHLLGCSPADAVGMRYVDMLAPESVAAAQRLFCDELPLATAGEETTASRILVLEERTGNGGTVWTESTLTYLRDADGCPTGILAVTRDITERKRTEAHLNYLAFHDGLTGLPNRFLFADRLNQALSRAQRNDQHVAVMLLDLDRFKDINDTLGHEVGDRLLQGVTTRLLDSVRDCDTVARMGGDEFLIILTELDTPRAADITATRIIEQFTAPFVIGTDTLLVSTSIGITLAPGDGLSVETLIKNADLAMYRAKGQGGNTFQYYSADMGMMASARKSFEANLREALERQQLQVHFQPLFDLVSGQVYCMEALVRWLHPERGLLSAETFIPLAEEIGLVKTIDAWVLRTACRQVRAWHDAGYPDLRVAVNLSAHNFRQPGVDDFIRCVLEETIVSPQTLEVEVTERTITAYEETAATALHALRNMGVRIALDDFGLGSCSLNHLRHFPFNTLKIDRCFINNIDGDREDAAMVKAILDMARALGQTVVAEAVETPDQLACLRALGCAFAQGHVFHHPLPASACTDLLLKPAVPSLLPAVAVGASGN